MSDLSANKALVTGVGIGQAIAIELARRGAAVAAHYAYGEPGETIREIERHGGKAATVRGDLSEVAECERVADEAADALGGLDALVNNAGVTRELGFLDTDESVYDEAFDLDMKGYFFCARRAVPRMIEAGGGSIVNISSVHGHGPFDLVGGRRRAPQETFRKAHSSSRSPGIATPDAGVISPSYSTPLGRPRTGFGVPGFASAALWSDTGGSRPHISRRAGPEG